MFRAPLTGRVVGVSHLGLGSILSPGAKVTEMLPQGRAFIVQAPARPQDVDDDAEA